jgi:hypothetical protein
MKCPNCGGKGKYKNGFGKIGVCYYCLGTGKVNDKGERVKTEQEYIQTCTTEQLAEFLHGIVIRSVQATWDGKKPDYPAYLYDWKMWLKQPHKPFS